MKTKALLLIAPLLTGCVQTSPTVASSMQVYSPDTLELKAGTTVQTKDGIYTSQVDERWYSADIYMKRVQEALNPK
jgi:hypothetical protein